MEFAVEIRNLKKSFGERKAIESLTLEIKKGECFGLLGPNGAGKTTLLRMLAGLTKPDDGQLFMLGLSAQSSQREIKSRIGVVPQGDGLDSDLTVFENLTSFASYFGVFKKDSKADVRQLLQMVGLEDRAKDYVETLSGGLKRRLAIVRALINEPEMLVLDEPTVALDPQARIWVWNFLKDQLQKERTIILSTHSMEEAEALCGRIGLLHRGKLIEVGNPAEVIKKHWGQEVVEVTVSRHDASYYANRLKEKDLNFQWIGDRFLVRLREDQKGRDLVHLFDSRSFSVRKPNLNDVFLGLTGSDLSTEEGA